jgi:hypothetical protein
VVSTAGSLLPVMRADEMFVCASRAALRPRRYHSAIDGDSCLTSCAQYQTRVAFKSNKYDDLQGEVHQYQF